MIEKRNRGGVEEHRHKSRPYWHPVDANHAHDPGEPGLEAVTCLKFLANECLPGKLTPSKINFGGEEWVGMTCTGSQCQCDPNKLCGWAVNQPERA